MNDYIDSLSRELGAINSLDLFWDRILAELANYGVTSISYAAIATHAEAANGSKAKSMIIKSNHSQKYFDSFGLDQLVENCKAQDHKNGSVKPVIWYDRNISGNTRSLQTGTAVVGDMGLHIGFTLPTTFFSLNHYGAIGVSMAKLAPSEFEENWSRQKDEIFQILRILNSRMRDQYIATIIGLSAREKECLSLLALGQRPAQIANQLGIGVKAIDRYISNARDKLKASTRDQAVANAVIFKVIQP